MSSEDYHNICQERAKKEGAGQSSVQNKEIKIEVSACILSKSEGRIHLDEFICSSMKISYPQVCTSSLAQINHQLSHSVSTVNKLLQKLRGIEAGTVCYYLVQTLMTSQPKMYLVQ